MSHRFCYFVFSFSFNSRKFFISSLISFNNVFVCFLYFLMLWFLVFFFYDLVRLSFQFYCIRLALVPKMWPMLEKIPCIVLLIGTSIPQQLDGIFYWYLLRPFGLWWSLTLKFLYWFFWSGLSVYWWQWSTEVTPYYNIWTYLFFYVQ
jgi:hypothetical protein